MRPTFSQAPERIARSSASLLSGKAARRLASPIRCCGRSGPSRRAIDPPILLERSGPSARASANTPRTTPIMAYSAIFQRKRRARDELWIMGPPPRRRAGIPSPRRAALRSKARSWCGWGKDREGQAQASGRLDRCRRAGYKPSSPFTHMCGLYGSIAFAPERARIDLVAHRGPDGAGWREFTSAAGPVALGHRRLAILDLSDAGLQPMPDASGRFHLVFNGEIYNYLELRDELRRKGRTFSTDTDSEVLLAAYAEWGEACLERLRGMWAFLIWDGRDERLFAARDRFGIKPLYVAVNRHGVAFASEIKQLVSLPGLSGRMNLARVRDFLASGISDHTDETLFEGVRQLRPGSCVTIDASRGWDAVIAPRRWYAIPPHGTLQLGEDEAAEQFRSLLEDSVRLHLRSDVPVGSCLSGGLDSSSIVGLMSGMLAEEGRGNRVNTVSACYTEKAVDERPFMEAVVARTGAIPHQVFP